MSLINKKKGGDGISIPVQRKEEEDLLRSVVKDKPLEFPTDDEIFKREQQKQLGQKSLIEESSTNIDSEKLSRMKIKN